MRVVIQRVAGASVEVAGETVGSIGNGILVLLGVAKGDTHAEAQKLAQKTARMRIFSDESDKLNLSLSDIGGGALVVSNFTLYAKCAHGNRPDFTRAAGFEEARSLYLDFVGALANEGVNCETGRFGEDMKVKLTGDGPVTIILDSEDL